MSTTNHKSFHKNISASGLLIATGIIFGDIGTSPLYTLNAVFHGRVITEAIALGSLSCIFWTPTFQTKLKYVLITLQAENKVLMQFGLGSIKATSSFGKCSIVAFNERKLIREA